MSRGGSKVNQVWKEMKWKKIYIFHKSQVRKKALIITEMKEESFNKGKIFLPGFEYLTNFTWVLVDQLRCGCTCFLGLL